MNLTKYALVFIGAGILCGLLVAHASETAATAPAPPATASAPAAGSLLQPGNPALPRIIYTEVLIRDKAESIKGNLCSYDEDALTINSARGPQTLLWRELTGASAFTLRSRLIDKTQPRHWLALGTFAWAMGTREQARTAFDHAVALDNSLRSEVENILHSEPGAYLRSGPAPADPAPPAESQPARPSPTRKPNGRDALPGELFPEVHGR